MLTGMFFLFNYFLRNRVVCVARFNLYSLYGKLNFPAGFLNL